MNSNTEAGKRLPFVVCEGWHRFTVSPQNLPGDSLCRVLFDRKTSALSALQLGYGQGEWFSDDSAKRIEELRNVLVDSDGLLIQRSDWKLWPCDQRPDWASLDTRKLLSFQVAMPGDRRKFDQAQPSLLKLHVPYSAAISGTDMGEQLGGIHYWKRGGGWGGGLSDAARYTEDVAEWRRQRLVEQGCVGVEVVDANVLEARVQVMIAVGREMEETLPRAEYLALRERIESLPDEVFAKAVPDLAKTGELTEPSILSVSRLGVVAEGRKMSETGLSDTERLKQIQEELLGIEREGAEMAQREATPSEIAELNVRRAKLRTERGRIVYRNTPRMPSRGAEFNAVASN